MMEFMEVMTELEALGDARMKRLYMGNGAKEPVFGVATGKLKPLGKANMGNQALAEQLYQSGCYDAMYLAGMIADVPGMTQADFDRWMDGAYFPMLSDYVVAVTLAESDMAQRIADRWIDAKQPLRRSAGWRCYEWLLGTRKDAEFNPNKLLALLDRAKAELPDAPEFLKTSLEGFIAAVGVSFAPLHGEARQTAVEAQVDWALTQIDKTAAKGKIGFKRRNVRC